MIPISESHSSSLDRLSDGIKAYQLSNSTIRIDEGVGSIFGHPKKLGNEENAIPKVEEPTYLIRFSIRSATHTYGSNVPFTVVYPVLRCLAACAGICAFWKMTRWGSGGRLRKTCRTRADLA